MPLHGVSIVYRFNLKYTDISNTGKLRAWEPGNRHITGLGTMHSNKSIQNINCNRVLDGTGYFVSFVTHT